MNNNTTDAANLVLAINRNIGAIGATATSTGAVVTVTANTAGTGGNGTTLASGATGYAWTGGTTTGGSDGTTSGTAFKYWTTNAYDTEAQLATDLAASLNANATVTGALTVSANTNQVTFTAKTGGATGNSYAAANGAFSALSGTGNLAGGVDSTVNPNTYPVKYSFSTTTASCSDYVAYPTGFGGSQATIVGYNSLYATTCASPGPVPNIAFAYNTGGTAGLSPIVSLDGTQIAYVESVSNVATLVLLKPSAASGGTVASPVTANLVGLGSYQNCTAPCYTTLTFSGGANDTNSSPYYDYNTAGGDILWVGDDSGKLHEFTDVFNGTPAENLSNWPVTVDSGAILTSPVWESISGNVFVGDSKGKLSRVNATGTPAVTSSVGLSNSSSAGIVDAPLIDEVPATALVYAFVGDSTVNTALVERFATNFASGAAASATSAVSSGSGSSSTAPPLYAGTFDNIHYDIAGGAGGFMWVCGGHSTFTEPELVRISMAAFTTAGVQEDAITTANAAACSPVTEFLGTKPGTSITTLTTAFGTGAVTVTVGSTTGMAVGDLHPN